MATTSQLVDKSDIPEERKDSVKRVLHYLGYGACLLNCNCKYSSWHDFLKDQQEEHDRCWHEHC